MKLVTFTHNGSTRIGAMSGDDTIVDLTAVDASLPATMLELLAAGGEARIAPAPPPVAMQRSRYPKSRWKRRSPVPVRRSPSVSTIAITRRRRVRRSPSAPSYSQK